MLFLRFLLISILVLYIIRSLVRLLLPMLFQNFVNKAQQQQPTGGQQQYRSKNPPEGKVKVDYIPKTKNSVPDSEGEFVDYEEIK
jgi:Domain of unknown function (DUF4834)